MKQKYPILDKKKTKSLEKVLKQLEINSVNVLKYFKGKGKTTKRLRIVQRELENRRTRKYHLLNDVLCNRQGKYCSANGYIAL